MPVRLLRSDVGPIALVEGFQAAIAADEPLDLVLVGRRSQLMVEPVRLLALGGREAIAALWFAPLYPTVIALLIEARKLGRTFSTRPVAGGRELVIEIRKDERRRSRER